jgi:phage tail sheath protein FI
MDHPIANGATNWGTTVSGKTFANLSSNVTISLTGGVDGTIATGNVISAYDLFDSTEAVDISLVISGPANESLADSLITMCEDRKDCIVFLSPEKSDVVNNPGSEVTDTKTYRDTLTTSSYAVMDSNWKYQYDKYNDVYRWIPCNGDVAGLCARTDLERDPWFSPGGLNRGIIKNVIKLAYNPSKTNRDDLYVKGINPIVSFQGEGTVLFGDKTLLVKPSAFDRINVRRLFIVLEKAIARAARFSLFEFNDQFTRAQFVSLVEPFLRDVQGRRGITDFRVVCDETNNTGEVIDRNEFIGDIYIKPARSINFIQLNFVAVRTGVAFEEIVGQF